MDTGKAGVYGGGMNAVPEPWICLSRLSFARKFGAAFLALSAAAAMWSCDSHDSAPKTAVQPPPVVANSDTLEGEPVVMSQEELASEYATLGGLVAEANSGTVWRQFRAQQQATLSVTGERLVIKVTGDNPVVILPNFARGQRFILEAIIDSENVTTAQLYYLTPDQKKYSEDQSQLVELKTGRNVVYFKVDDPAVIDPIRFDPASTPGTYTIERMTARALPAETADE
jgi:hypothetical protein